MPAPEAVAAAEAGEYALGGCVIGSYNPDTACLSCQHEWVKPTSPFDIRSDGGDALDDEVRFASEFESPTSQPGTEILPFTLPDTAIEFAPVMDLETLRALHPTHPDLVAFRSSIQVVCSAACRHALVTEGGTAPVSIWASTNDGFARIAGEGPYRQIPSIAITDLSIDLGPDLESATERIIAASQLIDDHTITDLRTIGGDPRLGSAFTAHLNTYASTLRYQRHPNPLPPYVERHFTDIDVIFDDRVVTVATVAVDRPTPRRITLKDKKLYAHEIARAVDPAARIMSRAQVASAIEQAEHNLAHIGPNQRCAHPRLAAGRCAVCGDTYLDWMAGRNGIDLTPRNVLHRGVRNSYRWYLPDQRRVGNFGVPKPPEARGTGAELLEHLLVVDTAPNPEPYQTEPAGPDRPRPLVAGHYHGHAVILFEDDARRLAEMHRLITNRAPYREILGTAVAYGYTWVNDTIDSWREQQADEHETDIEPIDPSAPFDVPDHLWVNEEGFETGWPYLDSNQCSEEPHHHVAQWLGPEFDEYDVDYEFGVRILDTDLSQLVNDLANAGAPIRFDQDLIDAAAGFHR